MMMMMMNERGASDVVWSHGSISQPILDTTPAFTATAPAVLERPREKEPMMVSNPFAALLWAFAIIFNTKEYVIVSPNT